MKIPNIRRFFSPRDVQIAIDELNLFGKEFSLAFPNAFDNDEAFELVKAPIMKAFLGDPNMVLSQVKRGVTPRNQVYFAVANKAGDLLESGEYIMYGVINPLGPGFGLLRIFESALNKLVENGLVTKADAESNIAGLKTNIKSVG